MSVHRFWYKGNFDVIYFWCWWWFPRFGIKLPLSHLTETEVMKAPVIWNVFSPATVLGFWPGHSIFMQVNYLVCGAKVDGQFPCTLYKATFLAARSDQNVCKITMWCVKWECWPQSACPAYSLVRVAKTMILVCYLVLIHIMIFYSFICNEL